MNDQDETSDSSYDYIDFCPDGFDCDAIRECEVCRQMFVGPPSDSPICDDCFYEREDFEN